MSARPEASAAGLSAPLKAALWMVGAILNFSALAIAGRELASQLDTFELMLWRSLIGMGLMGGALLALGRLDAIRPHRPLLHLLRNLFHFTGQNLWYYAIFTIPLAQVFALEFSSPIWAAIGAALFLRERLTARRLGAILLGFIGILIVLRPGLATLSPGTIAAATAAIGFAGSAIFTRILTRTNSALTILVWMTTMQAGLSLLFAGADLSIALPQGRGWLWVSVIAAGGLLAHFCLTRALALAPAAVVMPLDFARLPLVAVIGMMLYGEPLDPWVFIGAALIFSANYVNIALEARAERRQRVMRENASP